MNRYFPEGLDIYSDNDGADMLEAEVANMNPFGRVAACGVIAEHTDTKKRAAPHARCGLQVNHHLWVSSL